MSVLAIRIYPDPVLRAKCRTVTAIDDRVRKLAADMVETMHAAPGIGLAAPQVGVEERIAVLDLSVGEDPKQVHVLINPEIVHREGAETDVEGCLSLPGLTDKVERPTAVRGNALALSGKPVELNADGWRAPSATRSTTWTEFCSSTTCAGCAGSGRSGSSRSWPPSGKKSWRERPPESSPRPSSPRPGRLRRRWREQRPHRPAAADPRHR